MEAIFDMEGKKQREVSVNAIPMSQNDRKKVEIPSRPRNQNLSQNSQDSNQPVLKPGILGGDGQLVHPFFQERVGIGLSLYMTCCRLAMAVSEGRHRTR